MAEVAERAGLTKGFVSKLERDLANVSVASLIRLCDALGISVGSLFQAPKGEVVRRDARPRINFGGRKMTEYLLTPSGEKRVQAILSDIEPGGGSGKEPYALPAGVEFVLILAGQLQVTVAGEQVTLEEGDALTFTADMDHAFQAPAGSGRARVLWVLSPALPDHGHEAPHPSASVCDTRIMAGPARTGGRQPAGHSYLERRPARVLAPVVSSVWVQRIAFGAAPYPHRSVPNGSVELRCRVGAAVQVAGPLTRPRLELLPPGTTVVGVRFRAGAAAGMLGVRPSELADVAVDAAELWGQAAATLGARVAESGPGEAAALLEQVLVGRLADAAGPDRLVAEAVRRMMSGRPEDVGALRSSLFLSERQFRRRCEAATGLTPKELQRMLRFQGFLARVQPALARGRRAGGRRAGPARRRGRLRRPVPSGPGVPTADRPEPAGVPGPDRAAMRRRA